MDVKMGFIKEEPEDTSDPEPCGVKDEEPEELRGGCPLMIYQYQEHHSTLHMPR